MTPDLKPFFAGTYFPKESGSRGAGLRDLILNVKDLWENSRTDLVKSAEELTSSLQQLSQFETGKEHGDNILKKHINPFWITLMMNMEVSVNIRNFPPHITYYSYYVTGNSLMM
ncbi:hypothetical protein GCM10025861_20910 [Methanobacterium petrolearium]|nr:hypothetical protein GCM10025861_20910 [Methanobacterium petrolearium]